jgi:hypothetical protein
LIAGALDTGCVGAGFTVFNAAIASTSVCCDRGAALVAIAWVRVAPVCVAPDVLTTALAAAFVFAGCPAAVSTAGRTGVVGVEFGFAADLEDGASSRRIVLRALFTVYSAARLSATRMRATATPSPAVPCSRRTPETRPCGTTRLAASPTATSRSSTTSVCASARLTV